MAEDYNEDKVDEIVEESVKRELEKESGSVFSRKEVIEKTSSFVSAWSDDKKARLLNDYQTGNISRRSFLKMLGLGSMGAVMASSGAGFFMNMKIFGERGERITGKQYAMSTDQHGISFDKVVDITDFGADPSGNSSSDQALRDAAQPGNLVFFPKGDYLFTNGYGQMNSHGNQIGHSGKVGFIGESFGDVSLKVRQGANHYIFSTRFDQERVLLKNMLVDMTPDNTITGFRPLSAKGCEIHNIELLGRGHHSDSDQVSDFMCGITQGGTGHMSNVTHTKGGSWSDYRGGNTKIFAWAGGEHNGTLYFQDIHAEEFSNNIFYTSRCPGDVRVEGGVFRNTAAAMVRISGKGSYADGCFFEVDPAKYTGPSQSQGDRFNFVRIERAQGGYNKEPGVEIRNCDMKSVDGPYAVYPIDMWETGMTLKVSNTRIEHNTDTTVIRRAEAASQSGQSSSTYQPKYPRWLHCDNVHITGSGGPNSIIAVSDAPDSIIENCCIDMPNSGQAVSGGGITLRNNCINNGCDCDSPRLPSDTSDNTTGSTTKKHTITISGGSSSQPLSYIFSTSGLIKNAGTPDPNDAIFGKTATGMVAGESDSYEYEGTITDFHAKDGVGIEIDGKSVTKQELISKYMAC